MCSFYLLYIQLYLEDDSLPSWKRAKLCPISWAVTKTQAGPVEGYNFCRGPRVVNSEITHAYLEIHSNLFNRS